MNRHGTDFHRVLTNVLHRSHGCEYVERNWEIRRDHVAFEYLPEISGGHPRINPEVITRIVGRIEERKALNMVPVKVGQKQMQADRLARKLFTKRAAKRSK